MSQIDRENTFRGNIVEHGVSKTSGGFPQFIAKFDALEMFDPEIGEWVKWDYDETEITGYFVLFGKNGETLTCTQVQKATGWDGASFAELAAMDLSAIAVQFRVERTTYKERERLEVTWIDEQDASPGRTVKKSTPEELKALDAKYKKFMKKSAPASAPKKTGKPGKVTKKGVKATQEPGPVTPPPTVPVANEAPASPPASPAEQLVLPAGKCTQQEAYETGHELKRDDITDVAFNEVWFKALEDVTGAKSYDNVTEEQWHEIKTQVLNKTSKF